MRIKRKGENREERGQGWRRLVGWLVPLPRFANSKPLPLAPLLAARQGCFSLCVFRVLRDSSLSNLFDLR